MSGVSAPFANRFLSTPSARRATEYSEGPQGPGSISIHALREEGDARDQVKTRGNSLFLSTPSARRATRCGASCG